MAAWDEGQYTPSPQPVLTHLQVEGRILRIHTYLKTTGAQLVDSNKSICYTSLTASLDPEPTHMLGSGSENWLYKDVLCPSMLPHSIPNTHHSVIQPRVASNSSAKGGFKLLILLPHLPKYWECRCVPLCPVHVVLGTEFRDLWCGCEANTHQMMSHTPSPS